MGRVLPLPLLLLLLLLGLLPRTAHAAATSALANCTGFDCLHAYVHAPDPHYSWVDTGLRVNGTGLESKHKWTGYILNMTSQHWLTPADSDRSIWTHLLVVVVPDNFDPSDTTTNTFGSMYMTGGCVDDKPPTAASEDLLVSAYLATHTASITSTLFSIPSCPITFAADPSHKHRYEDAIIAFTWSHFHDHPDEPEWLLRMPMTKGGVRGLDTMAAFANTLYPGVHLERFAVAGASKRGWTTWTVAAVDDRVVAAVPIVMDVWNAVENLHHHYKAYGGWTFAFKDYWELNFTAHLDSASTQKMFDIIDPTNYPKTRLQMPKLAINAGGDEFLLPDDTTFWWDEMQGKNDFLMIPNAEHSEASGVLELLPAVATFLRGIQRGVDAARPMINWTIAEGSGDIVVRLLTPAHTPIKVSVWSATTANGRRRDFRLLNGDNQTQCRADGGLFVKNMCANPKVLWKRRTLERGADGTWTATMAPPGDGKWGAFFVHFEFEGPDEEEAGKVGAGEPPPRLQRRLDWPISVDGHYQMTTSVSVVPQTFPFADCHGEGCLGSLV
jgi:PhoPQ-activated pathogenicity-related protein